MNGRRGERRRRTSGGEEEAGLAAALTHGCSYASGKGEERRRATTHNNRLRGLEPMGGCLSWLVSTARVRHAHSRTWSDVQLFTSSGQPKKRFTSQRINTRWRRSDASVANGAGPWPMDPNWPEKSATVAWEAASERRLPVEAVEAVAGPVEEAVGPAEAVRPRVRTGTSADPATGATHSTMLVPPSSPSVTCEKWSTASSALTTTNGLSSSSRSPSICSTKSKTSLSQGQPLCHIFPLVRFEDDGSFKIGAISVAIRSWEALEAHDRSFMVIDQHG